jgi:hypothetical protein
MVIPANRNDSHALTVLVAVAAVTAEVAALGVVTVDVELVCFSKSPALGVLVDSFANGSVSPRR